MDPAPESRIECDNVKDIFTEVINHVPHITEAVVWYNPLIVADLDTTGVVAGFGITITNLYSSGDPVRGEPEVADQSEVGHKQSHQSEVDCQAVLDHHLVLQALQSEAGRSCCLRGLVIQRLNLSTPAASFGRVCPIPLPSNSEELFRLPNKED